jgi:hypothetical protein
VLDLVKSLGGDRRFLAVEYTECYALDAIRDFLIAHDLMINKTNALIKHDLEFRWSAFNSFPAVLAKVFFSTGIFFAGVDFWNNPTIGLNPRIRGLVTLEELKMILVLFASLLRANSKGMQLNVLFDTAEMKGELDDVLIEDIVRINRDFVGCLIGKMIIVNVDVLKIRHEFREKMKNPRSPYSRVTCKALAKLTSCHD